MRKALTIFIIILLMPSLLSGIGNLVVFAQGGGGGGGSNNLGQFITTLQTLIPAALLLLAILANRYDQRYALVLFAASMASAIFLAAATGGKIGGNVQITLVQLQVTVSGPTSAYTGQTEYYSVSYSPSVPNPTVVWQIYANGTLVSNFTGSTEMSYVFQSPGKYLVVAIVEDPQNYAYGSNGLLVSVTNPPGPLGWIQGAIEGTLESFFGAIANGIEGLVTTFLQFIGYPLDQMVESPIPGSFDKQLFNEVYDYSVGLAMLFIAFSIAYNAFQGFYSDIIDLAGDVMYKLSVWALFAVGGITIYTYAASFINSLIYATVGPELGIASAGLAAGTGLYLAIGGGLAAIPFFANDFDYLISAILYLMLLTTAIATVRNSVMLAIVALIPFQATLWLFEWTRKIALIMANLLIGMMVAGLVAAFTIALLVHTVFGFLLLFLLPLALDIEFISTLALFVFTLQPGDVLASKVHSALRQKLRE